MSWVMHDVDFYNSLLKELAFKPDRSESFSQFDPCQIKFLVQPQKIC